MKSLNSMSPTLYAISVAYTSRLLLNMNIGVAPIWSRCGCVKMTASTSLGAICDGKSGSGSSGLTP